MSITQRMYSLAEVQEILNVSRASLYNYIRDGKMKAIKIGSAWRVPGEELERLTREGIEDRRRYYASNK